MSILRFAAAAALALAAAGTAAAAPVRIGIAAEPYPPFFVADASGQWTGWEIDIANAICAKMAAECEIVPTSWDGLIPELTGKKIDAIMASMSITADRQKVIDFSAPYYDTPAVLVGAKDAPDYAGPDSVAGKTIGVQQSTIHQPYAEAHFTDSRIKVYQTQDEANNDLASGRIDYTQADVLAMNDFIKTATGAACCRIVGQVEDDPAVLGEGIGVGLRKGDDALKARLNEAIAAMNADGTFDEITKRYFDVDISAKR